VLYAQKLRAELERKREHFTSYSSRFGGYRQAYLAALAGLSARYPDAAALHAAQPSGATAGAASDGAHPTREYERWRSLGREGPPALPFGRDFANHEDARAWAECLRGTTSLAVDGSQLMPWRDASIPVALVQAGIFENPHQPPTPYIKDITVEVLTPEDLLSAEPDLMDARTGEVLGYSERLVHLRRFELEVETLIARMRHHAEQNWHARPTDEAPPIIALYDGSLIVSFALKMPGPYRERYAAAARRLLRASEEWRIPLVGYIDTSYARDVLTMLRGLYGEELPEPRGLHDALLWQGQLRWGDRTPAFISARDDLQQMGYEGQNSQVAFVYLQTSQDRPPARLEFPRWVLDANLLDRVVDVVRCEVIAGNGYPYAIEAADAVAVISQENRAQFYALFQEFAKDAGIPLNFSRKALSKSRRRV
jgi:NurA domain